MTTSGPPDSTDSTSDTYIRGGAGFTADGRRVVLAATVLVLTALLVVAAALAVNAAHKNSRDRGLRERGVPVTVTVTSCLGTATGTGITANGFSCKGSFELDGHRYTDVIGGSSRLLQRGDIVRGVTDSGSPSTLSTVAAASRANASWRAFIGSISLTAGILVVVVFMMWRSRRSRRVQRRQPGGSLA